MTILQSAIAQSAAGATGYQISRSLRFNIADSATLSRTPGTAGNRKTWTWSGWIKRSALGAATFFQAGYNSAPWFKAGFEPGDQISVSVFPGASAGPKTTAVYRDLSAWYHIVVAFDTTQATAANRTKLYVNGAQVDFTTDLNFPSQNTDYPVNNTVAHSIGGYSGEYVGGYIAEVYLIDGQALAPTAFGETSTTTGIWNPIAYTGTYGTNGFKLTFSDNSNTTAATLGADTSGNGNNYTPNNFSVTAGAGNDSLVDSPTNYGTDTGVGGEVRGNYCTWNPLDKNSNTTLANGNLDASYLAGAWAATRSTFGLSSGKWYWEVTPTTLTTSITIGIGKADSALSFVGASATSWGYYNATGVIYNNSSGTAYGASYAVNNVIGVALDLDNGTLTFYKNGTSQGTAVTGLTSGPYFPMVGHENAASSANFGQRPFAYTAPSGFKALCSQNFATPTVGATSTTLAGKYFNPVLYTGNGSTLSVTGVGFQPDWVWAKVRSTTGIHGLFDVVRGVTKVLSSDTTSAENTLSGVTAFNSDGFSLGSDWNLNGGTYVAWNWKAGATAVTNTAGTITSSVSASTTSGFSVVTYSGNGTAGATVGHGLGVTPAMVIVKSRTISPSAWRSYNKNLANAATTLDLNSDAAADGTNASSFNSTAPTSSVFSLGTSDSTNNSSATYVAYCFAEVTGFSKFGSYVGNGSTDGTFVYTGFKPRFIMVKSTGSASWMMYDTARSTYNVDAIVLAANLNLAELNSTDWYMDILSNGFKLRTTYGQVNNSGTQFIFMAFAEAPINFARAR